MTQNDDTTSTADATAIRIADAREGMKESEIPQVRIIFTCTACAGQAEVKVPWSEHHCIPKGWHSRDVAGSHILPRRTDHIFGCSAKCRAVLDERYPPSLKPKWFRSS